MKLLRIDHLVITVKDIDKSLMFYRDVLGMDVQTCNGRWEARFGNQKINFHQQKGEFQPAAEFPEYGSQDLCFIVDQDMEEVKREIEDKGIKVEMGIVKRTGFFGMMDSIYLRDPDGNLIELSYYDHN